MPTLPGRVAPAWSPPSGGGGGGGTTHHPLLSGRANPAQHPMSSITGLSTELDDLAAADDAEAAARAAADGVLAGDIADEAAARAAADLGLDADITAEAVARAAAVGAEAAARAAGDASTLADAEAFATDAVADHDADPAAHSALFDAAVPPISSFVLGPVGGLIVDEEWMLGGASGASFAAGTRVGDCGWSIPAGVTGAINNAQGTGVAGLISHLITASGQFTNVNLGTQTLELAPAFRLWQRSRVNALNGASARTIWTGLHNDVAGAEPTNGFYWRYSAADGANWQCVVANNGARTVVDSNVAVVANTLRNREIICDGGGNVFFYIDGVLVATINTNLPTGTNRYGPNTSTLGTAGAAILNYQEDRYLLWWPLARGPLAA